MESDEVIFCHDNLPCISFLAFEEMRQKRELCDLIIKIQTRTIAAHRIVVAAGIPYFRTLFTKRADETEGKEISVDEMDPSALESLIHFAYTSKIKISVENVHSLLLASEILQLREVKDACIGFLSQRLHVFNVLDVCTFAEKINNQKLIEHCNIYIQWNFEEFSKSKDFLNLPYPCIKDIISRDELNVFDEKTVFDSVIKWVKFSPEERQNMLPDLLKEIRMTTFPIGYLIKHVAAEELVKTSNACKDLIQNVQSFHLLPEDETTFLNLKTAPRRNFKKQIYAICESETSVYHCDFLNSKWNKLKSDKSKNDAIVRVAGANDSIYIFLRNIIKIFHLKSLKWEVLATTHEHIIGTAVLAQGSLIYLFGSLNDSFFDKVRCFDTQQRKWLEENRMKTGRANTAITSLEESIYVTGGYWKVETFRTFDKYIPSTGQWCELSPMLTSRSLHGCASINEKIYVFGGCCRSTAYFSYSNSAEVYNPLTKLWTSIASMKTGRHRFSFLSHCRKIYVFGGETETTDSSRDAEFYDPKCDQWKSSFSVPERFVGAVEM